MDFGINTLRRNVAVGGSLVLAFLLMTTLVGCVPKNPFARTKPEESPLLDFAPVFSNLNLDVQSIQRLDADGDKNLEWAIFYRFDLPPAESNQRQFAPIAGLIYDVTACRPPSILPYPLDPGDRNYLGTDKVQTEAKDFLTGDNKQPELIVSSVANGLVTALSIFRWFDDTQNPCTPRYPGQQGYRLLGTFRGDAGVTLGEGEQVIVKNLAGFNRSQIAFQEVYVPTTRDGLKSFMQEDGRSLVAPAQRRIDFAFAPPASPRDSPYPEKSVLAFYRALRKDSEVPNTYLASDADPSVRTTNYGLEVPLDQLDHVEVKGIQYAPDLDLEKRHDPVEVTARVAAVHKDGSIDPVREVRLLLKGVSIPDRTDCEWKISKVISTKPWAQ